MIIGETDLTTLSERDLTLLRRDNVGFTAERIAAGVRRALAG